MKRLLPLFLVLLSLGSVLPAAADEAGFRDGDEQPFCESPGPCPDADYMDFRWLTQGHGQEPRKIRHGLRTARRWRSSELGGRNGTTFAFDLDLDEYRDVDMQLRVRQRNGRLQGYLYRGEYFGRHVPGKVRVWRPGRRSLKVGFSADVMGEGIERYRWSVDEYQRNTFCPGSCHSDGTRWFEHRV